MVRSAYATSLMFFKEAALERAMSGLLRVFAHNDMYYASPIWHAARLATRIMAIHRFCLKA